MICEDCGRELEKIGELTSNELYHYSVIQELVENSITSLSAPIVKDISFAEGECGSYFLSSFEEVSKARLIEFDFISLIKNRLQTTKDLVFYRQPNGCMEVYTHKD